MRLLDVSQMVILCSGTEWGYDMSPCSREAVALLERNERLVTWLVPDGGGLQDQVAAIRYKDGYYSLSLRMMKAVYRHVRLHKGFSNVEVVNGVQKQRIPELLLREKIRTQSRFEAMRKLSCVATANARGDKGGLGGKSTVTVTSKMRVFIESGLLGLAKDIESLPRCTTFTHSHSSVLEDFLYDFKCDFPESFRDKTAFMQHVSAAFDAVAASKWQSSGDPATTQQHVEQHKRKRARS